MDANGASSLSDDIQPQQQRTLERLFDTAAALFWEKGYAGTTTREIAAALGLQQASLYYHIASKEDLFYQLCVSSLEQLQLDVQSAVDAARDPLGRIRALTRAHLATLLTHQMRHGTMLTELRALSGRHHREVLGLRKRYAGLVRSVLEDAKTAGMLRTDIPAQYLCLALLNVLNWAVVWFRQDQELPADRLAGLFTPIYLTGAATASPQALQPANLGTKPTRAVSRTRQTSGKSTSEVVLDTAAVLFSRKGYAATSTREIAAHSRIQKASLYHHIDSKEDLLYNICRSSLQQIRQDVETAVQKVQDPLERTRALVRAHMESMLRDQAKHAATLYEMRALSDERLAHVISLRDAYEDVVRSVLDQAQRAGVLRSDIPIKYLCLILLGLMNRVVVWYRRKGNLSPGQLGDVFAAIFLTGAAATASD